MISKTLKYTDYDGNERTETFYFNLSKAELTMLEFEVEGGFKKYLTKIVDAQDEKQLMDVFKDILARSYGQKSPDGRRFIKSKELTEEFQQTEAYSELFMELATNSKAAQAFIKGVMPAELSASIPASLPEK